MKIITCICILTIFSCSPGKQGVVRQGKGGEIESAKIKAKCTPPQKSYAKEIDAKLKAEMDSLRFASSSSFEASFNQKVIKLREYSSKGLDLDLLTFRICEMANNRGFTNEQTSELIKKAMELWNDNNKTTQLQQTVISNNQSGGITAGNVFLGRQNRVLNTDFGNEIVSLFRELKYDSIVFESHLGDGEAFNFASQIRDYLSQNIKGKKISQEILHVIKSKPLNGTIVDTFGMSESKLIRIYVGPNN
jgi:hypothetical protein